MSIYHLSSSAFTVSDGEIISDFESEHDVILFVHAKWCGYCRRTTPEFKKAAERVGNIKFAMFEDVELKKMSKALPVRGFPTFFRIEAMTGKITPLDGFPRVADQMVEALR